VRILISPMRATRPAHIILNSITLDTFIMHVRSEVLYSVIFSFPLFIISILLPVHLHLLSWDTLFGKQLYIPVYLNGKPGLVLTPIRISRRVLCYRQISHRNCPRVLSFTVLDKSGISPVT